MSLCLLATVAAAAALPVRAAQEPARAFRIPLEALETLDTVRRSIASAAAGGFTAILAPVSLAPDLPGARFDAMTDVLEEAAARKLRVYASLDVGRAAAADEIPESHQHVLYQHPEWLMVPREIAVEMLRVDLRSPEYTGRLARWTRANRDRADGVYISPIHPEAIAYLAGRVTEVLRRYPVQGVHLDALRFPDEGFDYSRRAMELFRADVRRGLAAAERTRLDRVEAIDPFAYPEEFPDAWRAFRQSRLTELVRHLRSAIRAVHPEAIVTVGVTLDPEGALRDHLQDWRGWIEHRVVDAVARVEDTGLFTIQRTASAAGGTQ